MICCWCLCLCWCWCMLEMWRNCLAAGAGAGGEISGNGTMAARQLSSARPLPRWLKVRAPPPQVHCQDQPEPSSRHQSANQRRETLLPVLCLAVMVMVGPTPIHLHLHHAIMWRPAHGHHRYSTTYYNTIFNLRSLKSEYRFFFTESSSMA